MQNRLSPMLPSVLGLLLLLLTWYLGDGGAFLIICFVAWIVGSEYACRFMAGTVITPYLIMLFSPLLLLHYSSVGDFRIRLACFFLLAYILFLAQRRRNSCQARIPFKKLTPWRVWCLSLLAFAAAAVVLHVQGIHLSGDEPHYVMIAQSLVEDGDFDLKNNLENKTYIAYLPVEIRFHGSIHSGKFHSFHMPGLSFLLLPFFFLFKILGGLLPGSLYFRLTAALLNSFFALGLFMALRTALPQVDNDRLFLFFLVSFPLLFQAVHLFPELPAAALMIFAYIFGRCKERFFLAGLLLAGLPWLHLKYSIPAFVLALYLMIRLWQDGTKTVSRPKRLMHLLAAPALSLALLSLYSRLLYASFNPSVISPEKNFLSIPLKFRIETLLSFFLDQRDGLLVYAPVFLLVFLVFKKKIRTRIRDFSLLAAIFLSYILFHAFTTVRGGYSPAARPTLFVMWIMAVFLAAWRHYARPGIWQGLFRFLAGMTFFATAWLFYYPLFLYQPVTREVSQRASSWLRFLSSEALDLSAFFPSFLKKDNAAYPANWIWLGLLILGALFFYAPGTMRFLRKIARAAFPVLGAALLFLVCYVPHVTLQTRYASSGLSFFCNSKNFAYQPEWSGFRVKAGQDYDLFFDLKGSAASRINLFFFNRENTLIRVRNGKRTLLKCNGNRQQRLSISLQEMKVFSLGGRKLVHIGLETSAASGKGQFGLKLE